MNKRVVIALVRKAFSRKNIVMDYEPDSDPENWRTIKGAKVHLNGEGQIDGGAGGKFSGKAWTSEKYPHKSKAGGNSEAEKEARRQQYAKEMQKYNKQKEQREKAKEQKQSKEDEFNKFRFGDFGGTRDLSNNYLEIDKRTSADGNKCIVKVGDNHLIMTKYGYGLVLDKDHVVFLKDWQVSRNNYGNEVILNKQYWNVKKWGDWSGRFSETNPQNHDFKTWNSAAKEQEKAGNTVKW
jgi:hypothetical protein